MTDYDSIRAAASRLPVDEQIRLIDELVSSVPGERLSPDWAAEVERRSRELESGAVLPVNWEAARSTLFNRVGLSGED